MRRLIVMLPCLNEAAALPGLLARLDAVRTELASHTQVEALVVDDGSTDGTAAMAQELDQGWAGHLWVHLEQHPVNMGLGAALLTGIRWFAGHAVAGDCLAVMDADGTHPPELLPRMLRRSALADVVIASRYAPEGREFGLSARRKLYSRGASIVLILAARVRGARDYSCGYRLYTFNAIRRGLARYGNNLVSERSFVCMAELLCKLAACGAKVAEVPLELHYELKAGASKMNVPVTIRRYVALIGRLLFTREFRRG